MKALLSCTSESPETTIANINKNKQNKTDLIVLPISDTFNAPMA